MKIVDIDPSIEAEDVEEAVRGFFDHRSAPDLEVSLTKSNLRGNRKTYVIRGVAQAPKLLKATHIKIRWVFCKVHKQTLALAIWRRTVGGLIGAGLAGGTKKRDTLFNEIAVIPLRRKRR